MHKPRHVLDPSHTKLFSPEQEREIFDLFHKHEISEEDLEEFCIQAWPLLKSLWKACLPILHTEVWGYRFLLSKMFRSPSNKLQCVWYVKIWDTWQARLFYYSLSGSNWHCAPFKDNNWYSKWTDHMWRPLKDELRWLSYETATIVSDEFQQLLSIIPCYGVSPSSEAISNHFQRNTPYGQLYQEQFAKELSCNDAFLVGNSDLPSSFSRLDPSITENALKALYKDLQLPKGLELDENTLLSWNPGFSPDLWQINTDILTGTLDSKDIAIHVCYAADNPALFWIQNISYMPMETNSFGVASHQINGWLFTTKAVEHDDQVPVFLAEKHDKNSYNVDIRPYIQENPLIKAYRRIQGLS